MAEYVDLSEKFLRHYSQTQQNHSREVNHDELLQEIYYLQVTLLPALNEIVTQYQEDSEQTISNLELLITVLVILLLLSVALISRFAFRLMMACTQSYADLLSESEEKYRSLFNDSKDAIFITSHDGNFTDVNSSFLKMFGYSQKELEHVNANDTYFLENGRNHFIDKISSEDSVTNYPAKTKNKSGDKLDCFVTASTKRDQTRPNWKTIAYQGIIRDITEQKKTEQFLIASEADKKLVLESIAEGIFKTDVNGICTFANSSCVKLLGFNNANEVVGKYIHSMSITHMKMDPISLRKAVLFFIRLGRDKLSILKTWCFGKLTALIFILNIGRVPF